MQAKPVVSRAKAYLKVRQKNVRDAMKELKLDGILLTHPPDLAYLTNFTGTDSVGLITEKDFYLVTDFRYKEQAGNGSGLAEDVDPRREDGRCLGEDASLTRKCTGSALKRTSPPSGRFTRIDHTIKEMKEAQRG